MLTSFLLLLAHLWLLSFGLVVDERLLERGGAVLGTLLVYNDMLAHEVEEATGIWVRVACRDLCSITHVQPNLNMVLSLLLEVIRLQVVNNGKIVDVSATGRDVPMLVSLVIFFEVPDQLLGVCKAIK